MTLISFFLSICFALYLPDMKKEDFKDKTIAYYPGSFDPIHLGHQNNINETLKYVDYVIVYPAADGRKIKKQTQQFRFDLMKTLYQDHPRVIWTDQMPYDIQEFFREIKNVHFYGVVGSDRALEAHNKPENKRKKYFSVWMSGLDFRNLPEHFKGKEDLFTKGEYGAVSVFKAEKIILSKREQDDLIPLHGKLGDIPIAFIIESQDYKNASSTKVREAAKKGESLTGLVDPKIEEMVKENYK